MLLEMEMNLFLKDLEKNKLKLFPNLHKELEKLLHSQLQIVKLKRRRKQQQQQDLDLLVLQRQKEVHHQQQQRINNKQEESTPFNFNNNST